MEVLLIDFIYFTYIMVMAVCLFRAAVIKVDINFNTTYYYNNTWSPLLTYWLPFFVFLITSVGVIIIFLTDGYQLAPPPQQTE